MIEVNLVPDVKQELLRAQSVRSTVISVSIVVGIIFAAIVTLLAIYVFAVQTVQNGLADKDIKEGARDLSSIEDLDKTLTLQNQLKVIGTQYDTKKVDSRLFSMLTAMIPPEPNTVKLSAVTMDAATKHITIEGQALNGYSAVEVFKKTIDAATVEYRKDGQLHTVKLASNVNTSETSYGEDANGTKVLRFNLSFDYVEDLFAATSTGATIKIGTKGNVTDSYLGVPQSIFADKASDLKEGK